MMVSVIIMKTLLMRLDLVYSVANQVVSVHIHKNGEKKVKIFSSSFNKKITTTIERMDENHALRKQQFWILVAIIIGVITIMAVLLGCVEVRQRQL